jgi:hypothetical protein
LVLGARDAEAVDAGAVPWRVRLREGIARVRGEREQKYSSCGYATYQAAAR